jgi:hypothetical protein
LANRENARNSTQSQKPKTFSPIIPLSSSKGGGSGCFAETNFSTAFFLNLEIGQRIFDLCPPKWPKPDCPHTGMERSREGLVNMPLNSEHIRPREHHANVLRKSWPLQSQDSYFGGGEGLGTRQAQRSLNMNALSGLSSAGQEGQSLWQVKSIVSSIKGAFAILLWLI